MPGPGDNPSKVGAYDRIVGQHGTRSSWSPRNSQTFRADPDKGFKNLYVHTKKSRWTLSSQYRATRREKKIAGAQVMKDALDRQFGLGAGEKVFRHIQSRSFRGRRNLDQEVTRGDLHRINDALAELKFKKSYEAHGSPKLPDAPKTFAQYVGRMQHTGRLRVDGAKVFKLIERDYGSDMAETLFSSILGVDVKTGQAPRIRLKPADVLKMQQDLLGTDPFSKLFQQRLGSKAGDNVYLSYDVETRQFADDRPDVARDKLDPAVDRRRRAAGTKIWRMLRNEVGVHTADKIFTDVFGRRSRRDVAVTYGDLDEIYAHMQTEKLLQAGYRRVDRNRDSKDLKNCYRMMVAFVTSGVIDRQRYHDYECLMRLSPERAAKALIQETEAVGNSQGNAPKPPDMIEQLMVAHAAKADQAAGTLLSAYSEGWRRTQQNGLARACAEIAMDRNGKFSRERARQVVNMLATGKVSGTLIPETNKMSDHTRHMIRILTLMCDNRSFRKNLDGIGAPIGQENPARDIVRKTLGLPADAEITEIHARQAALSALLGNIRQAKTGSCFATSLAIQTIKNDPSRTLSELKQLIETGKMTVLSIMNNTRWEVPISRGTSTDEVKQPIRLDGDGMLIQASRRKVLDKIPFHEMPPVTAALTAMGIPNPAHAAAVKAACADCAGQLTTPEEILRRVAIMWHGLTLDHFRALEKIRDLQHQAQEAGRRGDKDDAQKLINQLNATVDTLHMRALEDAVELEDFGDGVREDARRAIEQDIRDEIEWDGKDDIKDDSKEDIGQAKKKLFDLKVQQIALSNGRTVAKYRGEYYLLVNKNLEDGVEIKGPLRVKSLLRTEDVNAANDMVRRGIDGFEAAVDNRLLRAWEYTIADLMLQGDGKNKIEDRPVAGLGGDQRDWKSVAPEKDLPLLPFMERQFFVWKKQPRGLENQLERLTDDPDRPKADKADYGRFVTGWDRAHYAKDMPLTDESVFLMKFQDRVASRFLSSLKRRFVSVYEADEDFGQESGFTLYDTRNSSRRENWRRIDSQEAYLALAASLLKDAARNTIAEMGGVGELPDDIEEYLFKVVDRTVAHVLRPEHAEVVRKAVDRYDTRIGAVCETLPWQKAPGGWTDIYQKYTGHYRPKHIGTVVDDNTSAEDRDKRAQVLCQDLALFIISNRQNFTRLQKSRDTNIQIHTIAPNHGFNIGLQMQGAVRNAGALADAWKFNERDVRKAVLGNQASREVAAKAYADIVADGRLDEDMNFDGLSVDEVIDKVCRAHWRAAFQKSSFHTAMVKHAQAHIWMSKTLITPGREISRAEMSVGDQRALVTRMLPDLGLPDRNDPIAQDLLNAITKAQTPPQLAQQVVETLQANRNYAERQQRREDPDWADRVPANLVCWTKEPPPHVIVADYNHEANGFAIFVAFVYNPFIDAVECRMIDEGGNIGALGKNHYDPTSRGIWTISDNQPKVA